MIGRMIKMITPVLASIFLTAMMQPGLPIFVYTVLFGYTAVVCKFIWHDVPINQYGQLV